VTDAEPPDDDELRARLASSGYEAPGFAERYDRYRPSPPPALLDLLPPLAGVERPELVVDLGCGTGLSTRIWANRAERVVGVEPNAAMTAFAAEITHAPNVEFVDASAYDTRLPEDCADIVTASQSLHWMRPELVFPEIGRVLRRGGVLCAYEYFGLATSNWECDEAYLGVRRRTTELRAERGLTAASLWPLSVRRLDDSRAFRHTRELALHSVESGDGDRLVGVALSEGRLQTLLADGATEEEIGLTRLRAAAGSVPEPIPWWIAYRVFVGVR
jgi:SAM-dependent methyltransferase